MTLRRLDSSTRLEWQHNLTNSDKQNKLIDSTYTSALPTFQQLELFLDHRIRALEMSAVESKPMQSLPNYRIVPVKARVHAVGAVSGSPGEQPTPRSDKRTCPLGKEDHTIFRCETFKGRSAEERRDQVYRLQLCLNCLGKHRVRSVDLRLPYRCPETSHSVPRLLQASRPTTEGPRARPVRKCEHGSSSPSEPCRTANLSTGNRVLSY
jgi:hypothetical protein